MVVWNSSWSTRCPGASGLLDSSLGSALISEHRRFVVALWALAPRTWVAAQRTETRTCARRACSAAGSHSVFVCMGIARLLAVGVRCGFLGEGDDCCSTHSLRMSSPLRCGSADGARRGDGRAAAAAVRIAQVTAVVKEIYNIHSVGSSLNVLCGVGIYESSLCVAGIWLSVRGFLRLS